MICIIKTFMKSYDLCNLIKVWTFSVEICNVRAETYRVHCKLLHPNFKLKEEKMK